MKYKAYQKLKDEKDKLFSENQVYKKYRGIFRGLKRTFQKSKQPNKLTEYEVPTDTTRFNKVVEDFDPAILFEKEYSKDFEK